jgi:hypothetical protein
VGWRYVRGEAGRCKRIKENKREKDSLENTSGIDIF